MDKNEIQNLKSTQEIPFALGEFRTFTGETFDVFNPDPNTIHIEDIAHSLSMQCRFGGHTSIFYSVAMHSIGVMNRVNNEKLALTALMHDASEAYLLDLPRPIKKKIQGYDDLEDHLMAIIAEKYGLIYPFPQEIKQADEEQLVHEWEALMNHQFKIPMREQHPQKGKLKFLDAFSELT